MAVYGILSLASYAASVVIMYLAGNMEKGNQAVSVLAYVMFGLVLFGALMAVIQNHIGRRPDHCTEEELQELERYVEERSKEILGTKKGAEHSR